jgi:hypothetical protein
MEFEMAVKMLSTNTTSNNKMQSVFRLAGTANLAEQRHWSRSAIGSLKIPLN